MGATLPAMSRYVQASPRACPGWGSFYGGNICGAVVRLHRGRFYLLPKFDLSTAALVAVAIMFIVAAIGFALSKITSYAAVRGKADNVAHSTAWMPRGVYVALRWVSPRWFRSCVDTALSLMFGATTYALSIILGVFLAGLGIGSVVGSSLARDSKRARLLLG